jgi:hypothetical protein
VKSALGFAALILPGMCGALSAHVISMSTGYAAIHGRELEYTFRIPDYEMAHVRDPLSLFEHVHFASDGEEGVRTGQECHPDPASGSYLCAADYRFSRPIERLDVECTFYQVTVPNHVHLLHAERAGKYDQAILDSSFPSAVLTFRPPTAGEVAITQSAAGFAQVLVSGAQLLLLFATAFAARNRPELIRIMTGFVAGQCASGVALHYANWQPQPRFAESAAALALAYLSLEMLMFPRSHGRWVMAGMLGIFSGMYFTFFINESGYSTGWVLAGAAAASVLALAIFRVTLFGLARIPFNASLRGWIPRATASALLCTGAIWFVLRLRN